MIICNTCRRSIPNDSTFCPFCGNEVATVEGESEKGESLLSYPPEALLTRAFLFLEEGLFGKASTYVEAVLNREPENGRAYLAKLMIDLRVETVEELALCDAPFDTNISYKRALRYGDDALKAQLTALHKKCVDAISERIEAERLRREEEEFEEDYNGQTKLLNIDRAFRNQKQESSNKALNVTVIAVCICIISLVLILVFELLLRY